MKDNPWAVLHHLCNKFLDCLFLDSAFLCGPCRCVLLNKVAELIKAADVLIYKITVKGFRLNNFMDHAQEKGIIGTRTYLEKAGCLEAGHCLAYINIGESATVFQHVHGLQVDPDLQRGKHITTEEDQVFGIFYVIDKPFAADSINREAGMMSVAATGTVMICIVGRAQGMAECLVHILPGTAP